MSVSALRGNSAGFKATKSVLLRREAKSTGLKVVRRMILTDLLVEVEASSVDPLVGRDVNSCFRACEATDGDFVVSAPVRRGHVLVAFAWGVGLP